MFCTVVTTSKSPAVANGLMYEIDANIQIGQAVQVPLRNSIIEGMVVDITKKRGKIDFDVKKIQSILGGNCFLTEPQIRTAQWMADYYCCSLRKALSVWLPSPPWKQLLPAEKQYVRLRKQDAAPRGKKQQEVVDALFGSDWVSVNNIRSQTGTSKATFDSLIDTGILESEIRKEEVCEPDYSQIEFHRPKLTQEQQKAYEEISSAKNPSLLFGITGSGKTEVYAQMIADCIERGEQTILLVPEILLTEHTIHRFEQLLDREHISIIHSRLTPAQRRNEWKRIHKGDVAVVIGSRSALFSPCQKLGLVIIDEEHEWTYKNEQAPRYHTRETAGKLCEQSKAKLVLGTATPSLEAWQKAQSREYQLSKLEHRYNHHALPSVRIVDLGKVQSGSLYPFSPPLLDAIGDRLKKGEQSVLFLNRRGVATSIICLDCRRRIVSPDSQLPFTLHQRGNQPYLEDHTSGRIADVPTSCPACHSTRLHAMGAGTQKVEQILEQQFPTARILRADADTLSHPEHMRLLLKKMREHQADILLGTQSVVKGLDLPGVTLAAVLVADVGLSLPHFRAGERIFQILTQLTGRSGRAQPGEVIIQTFRPDAPEVRLAAEHNVEGYLELESKLRLHGKYPPYTEMIRLICRGANPKQTAASVMEFIKTKSSDENLQAFASPTFFSGGKVWHVLLRGSSIRNLIEGLTLKDVYIDIDPIECV